MILQQSATYLLIPKASMVGVVDTLAENGCREAKTTMRTEKKMGERGRVVVWGVHINRNREERVRTVEQVNERL